MIAELLTRPLREVAGRIERKDISPLELTRAMLDRIERVDPGLHSYLTVTGELALRQARAAEAEIAAGRYRGPLHGVPLAVKDLIQTRDARTTCASSILADWVPEQDATVISRLYEAGAVLMGKLSLTEFAGIGYHPSVSMPVNPWQEDHWAGSSSSGSAVAAAASLCYGTLGTDTGGSLRFPAAACGVVGLKPTYGRVSRYGVFPLAESLDHVGPMTRTVADAALLLQVIAGFDLQDPVTLRDPVPDYLAGLSGGCKGLRIGRDRAFCSEGVEAETAAALAAASDVLAGLGAELHEVELPAIQPAVDAWGMIFTAECGLSHEGTFPSRAEDYSPAFRAFLETAAGVRGIDYARASGTRRSLCRAFEELFQQVDLLLLPTMPGAAMLLEGRPVEQVVTPEVGNALLRCTAPFSLTGSPAIAVPCGFTASGLPLSMQLIGRHGEEATLLRAAHGYEQATGWSERRPLGLAGGKNP